MGVDEGFDIYPALDSASQDIYDDFLEEILEKYKDAVHPVTGETLIRIIGEPRAEDAYICFQFGECPIIPYRCEYFLRFSSRILSRDSKTDYLREVYFIAKRYFPLNLKYWTDYSSIDPPYDWLEVYEARKKLRKAFPVKDSVPGSLISSSPPHSAGSSRASGLAQSSNVTDTVTMMPMNLFNFPTEIRLKIYEKLLVLSEPIAFETFQDPSWPGLYLSRRYGLCPAILRVNKRTYAEARSLLYSSNRFKFSDIDLTQNSKLNTNSAILAYFLSQIETENASFLHHIYIDFPAERSGTAMLKESGTKTLELIRDHCTGIAVLETLLWSHDLFGLQFPDFGFEMSFPAETLALLDSRFNAILSLKEVVVAVQIFEDEEVLKDDGEVLKGDEEVLKEYDPVLKKMRDYGWIIKVTKVERAPVLEEEDEYTDYEDYLEYEREQESRGRMNWTGEDAIRTGETTRITIEHIVLAVTVLIYR
jgi:hypothetical protein